jgi:hypothetical protein
VSNPSVVHGDTIIVGPSSPSRYGGPGAEETIVVDKSVIVKSSDGCAVTTIDVSGQMITPMAVVTIVPASLPLQGVNLPGVVIDGFTLT